jgi:hypothetical protein
MAALVQFVVLKREGKWVVKARDLKRFFSIQREAVDAAIRFANDSGKQEKTGMVLFQKSKTKFEKIWTYGENTYPRRDRICLRRRALRGQVSWRIA